MQQDIEITGPLADRAHAAREPLDVVVIHSFPAAAGNDVTGFLSFTQCVFSRARRVEAPVG